MGADCKSVGLRLHWFESSTCHADQAPFRGGLFALDGNRSAAKQYRGPDSCRYGQPGDPSDRFVRDHGDPLPLSLRVALASVRQRRTPEFPTTPR